MFASKDREPLTIGVKNTCHANFYTVLLLEAVRQSFGNALPFIVTCARAYRVDVAPAKEWSQRRMVRERYCLLIFVLRVYFWVTVHFYVELRRQRSYAEIMDRPEVLVIRNLALVRFASPSMLSVPMKDVFKVLTASI